MSATVLIVDDDPAVATVLGALLTQAGLKFKHAPTAEQALNLLHRQPFDLVVSDVRMPGMDGVQLLSQVKAEWPDLPVVLLTAHGTVNQAVEAMRLGADDYLLKPFDREELLFTLRKAMSLSQKAQAMPPPLPDSTPQWVGGSAAMKEVEALVKKAASSNATVLIRGETGSGKELVARAIHQQSSRRGGPFVAVHCAALAENLLESELFGYEKGAFTGAVQQKPGRVELAEGGTLFFDEIGDISAATQVKLLRLLQEREYERVGGVGALKADVRFVAATHRDLEAMVREGKFREDLFYRLNVVPVWMPPLSQRTEDIPPLVESFCRSLGKANGKPSLSVRPEAMARMVANPWPGNVRQLQNFIERLVVLSDSDQLSLADVERELNRSPLSSSPAIPAPAASEGSLDGRRRETEKQALLEALQRAGDNRTLAARLLGISRRTLYNKLAEHGLS